MPLALPLLPLFAYQRHTLATGGGTADRTIRIWNAALGNNIKSVDTGR